MSRLICEIGAEATSSYLPAQTILQRRAKVRLLQYFSLEIGRFQKSI